MTATSKLALPQDPAQLQYFCVFNQTQLKIISSWPIWNPSWITLPWCTTVQNAFEWVPRNVPKLFHMQIFAEHRNHCIGDLIGTRCHCDNSPQQYLPQWYYTLLHGFVCILIWFTIIYGNPFFHITKKLWVRSPLHSQIPYFLGAPFSRAAAHEEPPRHYPDLPETFLHRQLQASLLRLAQGRYLLLRRRLAWGCWIWPCLLLK